MQENSNFQQILASSSNCDSTYFNGFSLAVGIGDVFLALQQNGKHHLVLNTSYTVAKTLAIALNDAINQLEQQTNNHIMTVDEIQKSLSSNHEQ